METATFYLDNLPKEEKKALEQKLRVQPHIVDATVNLMAKTVIVTYHKKMISRGEIKKFIQSCGFYCQPLPLLGGKEALAIAEHKLEYKNRLLKRVNQ